MTTTNDTRGFNAGVGAAATWLRAQANAESKLITERRGGNADKRDAFVEAHNAMRHILRPEPQTAPDEAGKLAERLAEKKAGHRSFPSLDAEVNLGWVSAQERDLIVAALRASPPPGTDKDEDETYEIGKRDGYESAIQDLDLATGGDGEFRGSTIPGHTVDVPAMKARIIERLAASPPAPSAGTDPATAQ